jgi:HAD superfamily hydrolase (TIGR01549 family)
LLKDIAIIAFDLDDTLWPCMPTIQRAEETLYRWLQQNYASITDQYSAVQLVAERKNFMKLNNRFATDLSLMRREFLKQLAADFDYEPGQVSESGFDVFYQARQQVNFYDDVLPCLERLKARYRLGSISNGNANVDMVGLGHLIEHPVTASDLQIAKPDKLIFQHLVERFAVPVEQILYVGDHPEYDVVGSIEAGMQAVWINRENVGWPEHLPHPRYQISSLHELEMLLD